jgi:hypothetical protein
VAGHGSQQHGCTQKMCQTGSQRDSHGDFPEAS